MLPRPPDLSPPVRPDLPAGPDTTLLLVAGAPGTGKSTWARGLVARWPRPLVVWDLEQMSPTGRTLGRPSSSPHDLPRPHLDQGLPTGLPDGWDVVMVMGGLAMLDVTRDADAMAGGPDQRVVAWCDAWSRERAIGLVVTGATHLRQTEEPFLKPASGHVGLLNTWGARFGHRPEVLTLALGNQVLDRPYHEVIAWRHGLDRAILQAALAPNVAPPETVHRARL